MRIFEPTMSQQIDIFLQILLHGSEKSEPQNMTDRSQRLGFDIVGHLAFGCDLKLQTEEANRVMIRLLTAAKMRVNAFMHFPALQSLDFILTSLPSKDGREFRRIIKQIVTARVAEGDRGQHDLYAVMAEHTKPGGVYDGILWSEAIFFMTAGGTPPATTLSALFFYLSRYPKCYEKLAQEIRSQFASGRDIRGSPALFACKYLRACVDESLRMAPPSLATLWREQAADDPERDTTPIIIDGHVIPPGTQVGVNLYALHHNEDYFPDAFTFNPDRWLDSSNSAGQGDQADKNRAFAPFIVGPRSCAGRAMAYLEVSLVMAKTLWYFDFQKSPGALGEVGEGIKGLDTGIGNVNEYQLLDMFNANHHGPYLIFRPRGEYYHDFS